MRRAPLVPTIIVALAIGAMIALGVWQVRRATTKDALIALVAHNPDLPEAAMPRVGPVPFALLLRRSRVTCLEVEAWRVDTGRAADGAAGYRHIASCRTGAEGPGNLVDLGVSPDFHSRPNWRGGEVTGWIANEPDHSSVFVRALGRAPTLRPMLIAERPAPGLRPSVRPGPDSITNNSWGYAVQWFVFAGLAGVIYLLALRRRGAVAR